MIRSWMFPSEMHTYIRNWSLQPFSQDYDLAFHTIYVVCVNFIHEWRNPQFKVDRTTDFLTNFFMTGLFTLRVFAKNLVRGSRRRNIFIFSDLGFEVGPYV